MSTDGIPPSVLANLPAMKPPSGIKSNFIDPPSQEVALITLNAVFLGLMVVVVAMRLYAKAKILHTMGWDDYTCAIAALASVAHSVVMLDNLKLGYGRHLWDIRAVSLIDVSVTRRLSSTSIIYPFVIYFVKLSILLLYIRIFGVYEKVRLACYFGIVFFTLFYIAYAGVQVAFLVECVSSASLQKELCKNVYNLTIFQSAFNVVSDFYVFIIPIPRIIDLQVNKRQKIGLLVIFLAGLVACLVSIARLAITAVTLNRPDKLWNASLSSELTIVEMNLAIIAACMSTLPGFLARTKLYGISVYNTVRSALFSSRTGSTGSGNTSKAQGEGSMSSRSYSKPYIQIGKNGKFRENSDGGHSLDTLPLKNMV